MTPAVQPPLSRTKTPAPALMSRRTFLRIVGGGLVAAAVVPAVAATYDFVVEEVALSMDGLAAPLRLAWLSDMHFGPFVRAGSIAAWVDVTLDIRPDLILLGGDQVDRLAPRDLSPLLEELGRLRAPLGVYAVRGNHDHARFGDAIAHFDGELRAAGIETLVNRGTMLRDELYLAGIDDFGRGEPRLDRALAERPAASPCLLMSHNPDVLPDVPTSVDLTLCGHTHGGQVVLPLIGPPITSSRYGRRFAEGAVSAPVKGYVTRGLGVAHVPIRINCPPELTLVTLVPSDERRPARVSSVGEADAGAT